MLPGHMRNLLSALFACLIALAPLSSASAADEITLTTGEWPPYFSEEFLHGGLGARICADAFKLAGIDASYTYMPWKRAYDEVLHGEFEGTAAWRTSPEREKLFFVSDPVFSENIVFFYRKTLSFDWEELDDVGDLTIGVTLGYIQKKILSPIVRKGGGKIDMANSDTANFQKLIRGRIDAFPCSEKVGEYLLQTQFTPEQAAKIAVHHKPMIEGSLHLLISRTHPKGKELIERFNQGLKLLHEQGLFDRYIKESADGDYLPQYYRGKLHQ